MTSSLLHHPPDISPVRSLLVRSWTYSINLMKTKTRKTPLMMAVALGLTSCSSVLCLRASSCTVQKPTTVLFQNSAFMVAKTSPFGLKNHFTQCAAFLVERSETVFLPRMMSYVAKQCVVMLWQVRELAHWHKP